jgi:hypothetical protein
MKPAVRRCISLVKGLGLCLQLSTDTQYRDSSFQELVLLANVRDA